MSEQDEKRIITSAIDGMTVAEVRKALSTMRRTWEACSALQDESRRPLYVSCDTLVRGHTVQDFSYMFVQGHHAKRMSKSRSVSAPNMASLLIRESDADDSSTAPIQSTTY